MSIFFCIVGVLVGLLCFFLIKKRSAKRALLERPAAQAPLIASSVEDFSGDSRWDTELDLAKAYLELHQYEKAKHLLKSVITYGDANQILEARKMFTQLLKQERVS